MEIYLRDHNTLGVCAAELRDDEGEKVGGHLDALGVQVHHVVGVGQLYQTDLNIKLEELYVSLLAYMQLYNFL